MSNRSKDDLLQKEIEQLQNERRSSLQELEDLARHPDYRQGRMATNKEEYIQHIKKHYDQQIQSKRKLSELFVTKRREGGDGDGGAKVSQPKYQKPEPLYTQQQQQQQQQEQQHDSGIDSGSEENASRCSSKSATNTSAPSSSDDDDDDDDISCSESMVTYDDESEAVANEKRHDYHLLKSQVPRKEQDKIRKSKLTMAIQGFRSIQRPQANTSSDFDAVEEGMSSRALGFDPDKGTFQGRTFRKGRCYHYVEDISGSRVNVIVGIRKFLPHHQAESVLIVPFEDTILGQEEDGVDFQADFKMTSHCQVYRHVSTLHLKHFEDEVGNTGIPAWIYEPQTVGAWNCFGYFLDNTLQKIKRHGKREEFRVLELFAGAGGMHLGFQNAGFATVDAVDNDKFALATLRKNCRVFTHLGDVSDYLAQHQELEYRELQGRVDCIVVTAPCQGFSGANRNGGKHDKEHNDLSLTVVEAARIYRPPCLVYENVLGMWRRKHVHYLKNIVKELIKLDYQVRVTELRACDYGSAQIRPRIILFATHRSIPPPKIPQKTHGDGDDLIPFVTVQDALVGLEDGLDCLGNPLRNIGCAKTSLQPGQHGLVKLNAEHLAPAVTANSVPPLHYRHDRCISVRECATLQDFPTTFEFHGTLKQQYRQVGNAVPVELAAKIAQAVREVLLYVCER